MLCYHSDFPFDLGYCNPFITAVKSSTVLLKHTYKFGISKYSTKNLKIKHLHKFYYCYYNKIQYNSTLRSPIFVGLLVFTVQPFLVSFHAHRQKISSTLFPLERPRKGIHLMSDFVLKNDFVEASFC